MVSPRVRWESKTSSSLVVVRVGTLCQVSPSPLLACCCCGERASAYEHTTTAQSALLLADVNEVRRIDAFGGGGQRQGQPSAASQDEACCKLGLGTLELVSSWFGMRSARSIARPCKVVVAA